MSRECFSKLLEKVIKESNIVLMTVKKVLVFLFYFGHISAYRKLRELFGISHATLFRIIKEMADIFHSLSLKEIKFPEPFEYEELKNGFLQFGCIEGTILAIEGTLIKISRPQSPNPFNYYDRKGHWSINFICVVDHKQRFRGVTYEFGKSHDSRVLNNSELKVLIENIEDENCFVIGDSAYAGLRKIKVCRSILSNPLTSEEEYEMSKQRIIVENAFGRLKGKFKLLDGKIINGDKNKYIKAIKGIFFIHNFIIDND